MTEQKPNYTLSIEELTQGQSVSVPNNTANPHQPQSDYAQGVSNEAQTDALASQIQPGLPTYINQPNASQAPTSPSNTSMAASKPAEPMNIQAPASAVGRIGQVAQKHRHKLRPISYSVGAFLLFIVLFNFQLIAQQIGYFLNPPKPAANLALQDPNAITSNASIVPPESLIIIPKINVSAPIVYADSVAEDEVMKDLESGVVHYANTAKPGENGNAVIFGHSSNDWWESGNYKFVFALLGKLEVGDQVQVNYSSRKYVYEVTEKKVVQPSEVSVLNQTPSPILTLITCTPPGTSWQRLIVVAKQIQPRPTTTPIDQVAAAQKPANQDVATTTKAASLPSNAPSLGDQLTSIWSDVVAFFTPKPKDTQPDVQNQPGSQPRLPDVS